MTGQHRLPQQPNRQERREQRTFIVSILVVAMTGIAFQEMAIGVGEHFRIRHLDPETVLLAGTR